MQIDNDFLDLTRAYLGVILVTLAMMLGYVK